MSYKLSNLAYNMKILHFIYIIIISVLLTLNISYASKNNNNIKFDINKLLKQYNLTNSTVAISIKNAKNNHDVFSYNSHKTLKPASNLKLLVAAASFLQLGKNYTFSTSIYTNKRISPNAVDNLYIVFSGDPSLTSVRLNSLIKNTYYFW